MNERSVSRQFLKGLFLLCIGFCLLLALTPFTDFDFDGRPDSFATEGLLIIIAPLRTIVPLLFMPKIPTVYLPPPGLFSFLIVPPPLNI